MKDVHWVAKVLKAAENIIKEDPFYDAEWGFGEQCFYCVSFDRDKHAANCQWKNLKDLLEEVG